MRLPDVRCECEVPVVPNNGKHCLECGFQLPADAAKERKLYTFVGECRSLTAIRKGWSWQDGRLAAKPLFEALSAMGIDPHEQSFMNLYNDPPANHRGKFVPKVNDGHATSIRGVVGFRVIVALGKRVSDELARLGIEHVALVHPAARGRIRKRERYVAHVAAKLGEVAP